jgi:hypothetical protein
LFFKKFIVKDENGKVELTFSELFLNKIKELNEAAIAAATEGIPLFSYLNFLIL